MPSLDTDFVPVIDLAPARDDATTRAAVAAAIDEACRRSGFLVIVGHGVDESLIARMHDETVAFFLGDEVHRPEVAVDPWDPSIRGVFRKESNVSAAYGLDTPPDLCELYTASRLGEPGVAEGAGLGDAFDVWSLPNRWPAGQPTFRATWLDYYAAMEALSEELLRLFALALELPEDWFLDKTDEHITNLTANWYPPIEGAPLPGQLRKGEHSDYGSFTILFEDGTGGLEVRGPDGRWLAAPVLPGSYIVNIGDLLATWTNDRWVSTVHRVLAPMGEAATRARVSIPFFHHPNWDALIECIPSCCGPDRPARYAPVTAGAYLEQKMRRAYS